MGQVGFPQAGGSINQEGVEGSAPGFVCNSETSGAGQTVALSFDKLPKVVIRIQIRINVQFAQSRYDKGIFDGGVVNAGGHGDRWILRCLAIGHRHLYRVRTCLTIAVRPCIFHDDAILKARIGTQFLVYRLAEQLNVMLLQPFVKELRGHLDGQHLILNFERFDGRKPRFVRLAADVVFDYF